MKLSIKSLAITAGIIWGGSILLLGIANVIWPSYALGFLQIVDSIYPGYHAGTGGRSVIAGTLYGLIDGAIGGLIFAWVYNRFACEGKPKTT